MCQDLVTIGELNAEHCVRQGLDHAALDLDGSVFLRHVLRYLTLGFGASMQRHTRVTQVGTRTSRGTRRPRSAEGMREWTLRAKEPVYARHIGDAKPRSP